MKNLWKALCIIVTPIVFLAACGNNKVYTISFSGIGVNFDKATDKIKSNQTYTIGATAIGGYNLEQDDFTVVVGKEKIAAGTNSWNWSNNVLTIYGNIVNNDIEVSADAKVITYSASVNVVPGITIDPSYDREVSIKKDFVVKATVATSSNVLKADLTIGGQPSNKYVLNSLDNLNYEFKINRNDIVGTILVNLSLVGDDITVSKTEVSFLTYGNDAITYQIPSHFSANEIEATSSNTNLFTINQDKTNKKITIDSNLNGVSGTGVINFKVNEVPLTTMVNVIVTNPTNIDEAHDAFTLAAMKCAPNSPFEVTFDFNNTLDEIDFELSQEIYGRTDATCFINYSSGERVNEFKVNSDKPIATKKSEMMPEDEYYLYNPNNINYLNRKLTSKIDHTLYIDTIERELEVNNSDELFWAVEHGYKPNIPSSQTNLIDIYNSAREICSNKINPNWTEFEKMRVLFEELESLTHYDYWVIDIDDPWYDYQSYFLEGVFLDDGKAVCDGFSKAYALLCGIEGLPCIRSYGFSKDSGHAWNYIKIEGGWYLACPTWCKTGCKITDTYCISLMDYDAFATGCDYFADLGEEFSDLAFTTITKSNVPYCATSILSLDKSSGVSSYVISSNTDANNINTVVKNKIEGDDAYVCIAYKSNTSQATVKEWAQRIVSGVGSKGYQHCSIITATKVGESTYTNAWIYITKS